MELLNKVIVVAGLSVAAVLGACAGGGGSGGGAAAAGGGHVSAPEEQKIEHQVSAADLATAKGTAPVKGESVRLWVNGMGCPQCATNIDKQLEMLPGVTAVKVDLAHGLVDVQLAGAKRPSPDQIAEAVADAGFTLVKVEQR